MSKRGRRRSKNRTSGRGRHDSGRRPQEYSVLFRLAETARACGIRFDPTTGELALIGENGAPIPLIETHTEHSYRRDNPNRPRKVVFRAPTDPQAPSIDANAELWKFDIVLGVDTNTKSVNGKQVSVMTCFECIKHDGRVTAPDGQVGTPFQIVPIGMLEMHGVTVNPERLGWRIVCEAAQMRVPALATKRVALVVDSARDDLPAVNARTIPVANDWMLPEFVTLVYASTDSAKTTVANLLIAQCDKIGGFLLKHLPNATGVHLENAPSHFPFTHFRHWQFEKSALKSVREPSSTAPATSTPADGP